MKRLLLALALMPASAQAEIVRQDSRYVCDGAVEVPASYYTDGVATTVALIVNEASLYLYGQQAESGQRFGALVDGISYAWWLKDESATLLQIDDTGAETAVLTNCVLQS